MPNTSTTDNILGSRIVNAPNTTTHWTGADMANPDASKYVRGTVHLEGATGAPTVGRIESCSFSEMSGGNEELDDGACGVEGYDWWKLGWKVTITARFRTGDAMPRIGEVFVLNLPEGPTETAPLRFIVEGEPQVQWGTTAIRKITFSGKMHNSILRGSITISRVRADGSTGTGVVSAFPASGWGDAVPPES